MVQIQLEDLVLPLVAALAVATARGTELLLETPCQQRLAHLAAIGALVRLEEDVLHDLLRDRRSALSRPPRPQVHHRGARDAEVVDAFVLVEARVLGGDERGRDVSRQLLDTHDGSPLREQLRERRPVAREHARHL
ncbi:MAG: hypothetical protein K0S65_4869 [Labilithrix sp.]|nr:hypothetical protein [Labilithrix sp.]